MATSYFNQNANVTDGALDPTTGPNGPSSAVNTKITPTSIIGNGQIGPLAKPTSVVSSQTAANQANKAKSIVNNPPTPPDYDTQTGLLTAAGKAKGLPDVNAPKTPTIPKQTTPPVTTPTPEEQAIHEGQTQYFNVTTGQPSWLPTSTNGQAPAGYSTQNPATRTDVVDTADAQAGDSIVIKKFSDGTYGRFNTTTGDYTAASPGDFTAAQRVGTANTALDNLQKGILTPSQQSQVDALKQQFKQLIDKQTTLNANTTGATTIAENLYGMGNTMSGQGEITQTVNDGVQKIADLQSKMTSALADMTRAFESDDIDLLKSAYGQYSDSQAAIQKGIDTVQNKLQSIQDKQASALATQNRTNAIKYHVDIPDDATPQEARDILNTSPIYKYEQTTKSGTADPDVTDAQVKYYKTTGTLPTFSYGTLGHAERNAFWSAVGGNPSTIIDATSNKVALHAANTAQAKIQTIKSGTEASISALKTAIGIADDEMTKFSRTGSPFLNKPLNWIQDQLAGNKEYSGLNQAITTIATEYAKIKNGAAASIAGAPVTSVEEEKKLINTAMSNGQLDNTFDVIKKDSNGRLLGFNQALDSIKNDIQDLQSTDVGSSSSSTENNTNNSSSGSSDITSGWAGFPGQ